MRYYIEDELVEFDYNDCYLDHGVEATVFKIGNDVLKIYKRILEQDKEFKMLLSSLDTKRIIMPKRMVYKESSQASDKKEYCGYTSTYIKPGYKNLNLIKTSKICENFYMMDSDFRILIKNKIIASDAHFKNLIFDDEENMFFIDIGNFFLTKHDWALAYANLNTLSYMLKSVIMENVSMKDQTMRIEIFGYLMSRIGEMGVFNFLEKEFCLYDSLKDYQKYLVKKHKR